MQPPRLAPKGRPRLVKQLSECQRALIHVRVVNSDRVDGMRVSFRRHSAKMPALGQKQSSTSDYGGGPICHQPSKWMWTMETEWSRS